MEKKGISSWFCTDCCPGIEDVENRDVRGVFCKYNGGGLVETDRSDLTVGT
jgi:hypothetical protein